MGAKLEYVDFENDGDPDLLKTQTRDCIPVCWVDDDGMAPDDMQGDMDNDCLRIDGNKDGRRRSWQTYYRFGVYR